MTDRELLVRSFQLLQAGDVWLLGVTLSSLGAGTGGEHQIHLPI